MVNESTKKGLEQDIERLKKELDFKQLRLQNLLSAEENEEKIGNWSSTEELCYMVSSLGIEMRNAISELKFEIEQLAGKRDKKGNFVFPELIEVSDRPKKRKK